MKRALAFLLIWMLSASLAACGGTQSAPAEAPPEPAEQAQQTESTPEQAVSVIPTGDSFWVAYEYDPGGETVPLTEETWSADLTLWADGTARFREVADDIAVTDPHGLRMTWKKMADGTVNFYCPYSGHEPYYTAQAAEDGLRIDGKAGAYCLRQAELPDTVGALYCPAELTGVWLETGYEIEGYNDDSMPGRFTSLVIETPWESDPQRHVMKASSEYGDSSGYAAGNTFYNYDITVLDEALYTGCENQAWSVRIGPESPKDENGYPKTPELYATLLDRDTLLFQRYFSFDSGPGISYQTYKRIIPDPVGRDMEDADLEGTLWRCTAYTDAQGREAVSPPDLQEFRLEFFSQRKFSVTEKRTDGSTYTGAGSWILGEGNTLLLYGRDFPNDWFGGAANVRKVVTEEYESEICELFLWYEGGIMTLTAVETDGDSGKAADLLADLSFNAHNAPAGTLMVLYTDPFEDWERCTFLPTYRLSDSLDAEYLLISSVEDGTELWLEENGAVVKDFGSLNAGESLLVRMEIPESGGPNLYVSTSLGEYYYELIQGGIAFADHWSYITT